MPAPNGVKSLDKIEKSLSRRGGWTTVVPVDTAMFVDDGREGMDLRDLILRRLG